MKAHLDISIMYPLGTKKLTNENNIHLKKIFENKVQIWPSKNHNYHLFKVSQKTISHLTL
jgi:plasmid maintenance system antidote protein VapI